jgi:hypothetical protein
VLTISFITPPATHAMFLWTKYIAGLAGLENKLHQRTQAARKSSKGTL